MTTTNPIRRSRSSTSFSTRTRPQSRDSTASLQSFEQQPYMYQAAQSQHHQHSQQNGLGHSYTHQQYNGSFPSSQPALGPAQALVQAASMVSQREEEDPVHQLMAYDGAVNSGTHSHDLQPGSIRPNQHPMALQQLDPNTHYHNQVMPQPQYVVSPIEVEEKKKKGGPAGNATNDRELRAMLASNEGKSLQEVAKDVIASDRTSRAEKTKQLFAMLWLKSVCRKASTSVPRNRVYSKYAERCGTDRVIPLNPASFGKLVRVIFPNIATRRLGVRGESKYHYVDLDIINDEEADNGRRPYTGNTSNLGRLNSADPAIDFNHIDKDVAPFPSAPPIPSYFTHGSSTGRLFADVYSRGIDDSHIESKKEYEYELNFPSLELLNAEDSLEIQLPDIQRYVKGRMDPDSVDNLAKLYRSHCICLIDTIRFCKEKQFFRLFKSFHGTLTVPVQKLFAMPDFAPWIRDCDWMMYQKMIRNVSQLTLQVAPAAVLKFLDSVSKKLHNHISVTFAQAPIHVREAKLEPATLFAHLLRQMLRVNSTAHAAAVMLTVDDHRDHMWDDWQKHVNVKRVIESELPLSCDHVEVYKILTNEVRSMLVPFRSQPNFHETGIDLSADNMQETVIDRIAQFLTNLPSRFPHSSARTILQCVNAIGSATLREITCEQGLSLQAWWLTKVFIDEYAQWLASLGGFLSHNYESSLTGSPGMGESMNAGMTNGESGSLDNSRFSSIDDADMDGVENNQSFIGNDGNLSLQDVESTGQGINPKGHSEHLSFGPLDFNTSQPNPDMDDSGIGFDESFASLQST